MSDLAFNFEAAKQIAKQAGFSGVWYRQRNGRWRLPVDEDSGLEWSPTRSKLRIYGPDAKRAGLPLLVEKAVKSNLIASPGPRGLGEDDREIIKTQRDLLEWG